MKHTPKEENPQKESTEIKITMSRGNRNKTETGSSSGEYIVSSGNKDIPENKTTRSCEVKSDTGSVISMSSGHRGRTATTDTGRKVVPEIGDEPSVKTIVTGPSDPSTSVSGKGKIATENGKRSFSETAMEWLRKQFAGIGCLVGKMGKKLPQFPGRMLWAVLAGVICVVLGCVLLTGNKGLSDKYVRMAVDSFVESKSNPLRNSGGLPEYELIKTEPDDDRISARIRIIQESEKTHYEVDVLATYRKEDGEIKLRSCNKQDGAIYYPLQELDADSYLDIDELIGKKYDGFTYYEASPVNWKAKEKTFTVQIKVETQYPAYIDRIQAVCELYWDPWDEIWRYTQYSFNETDREFDFSPLNGVWNAKYSHNSTLLTQDDIPYTFTFSNAGTIKVKDGVYSTTTVNVQHELNELWSQYLNPEWISSVPNGTNYESGKMEIVYESSGQYFLIKFDETNVGKMFDGKAELRIDYRQIIYKDNLMARDCKLSK